MAPDCLGQSGMAVRVLCGFSSWALGDSHLFLVTYSKYKLK